ncbi:MAG: N-acetylmuramoyl-L-alanine amidase [Micavibrio aeruginosavorus]|uniref:N-acetylmuramoyl-L-alanine amidase n=1 Tax=Micavibrio aeruginosavorus TaxID=349221 RepID=A0A2W5PYB2_9BACT|nr:MAG: N-acetylmuramoyl-L-alanine amidase [Micavibrio aeruginosavorus]
MQTALEAVKRLSDPESKVSAHYTIDEDGSVYVHVDEELRAWHAGHSFWQGEMDINAHSIGIEIVNPGHEWGYRPFTGAQMKSLVPLCKEIIGRYNIEPDAILAHSDVAPARKQDPGEYFPWHELAKHGVGAWPVPSDEDAVKSKGMDIGRALQDFGYDPRVKSRDLLTAFQRHYVPEAFANGHAGEVDTLTRTRLYALLAGHWLEPTE